ncbi:MAG TPA: alpha/beta hydrolase [Gemmatimonadales bacterium]|nr:alpha/beta hydrolase [Gemmatimonadales bacterium]
MRRSQHRDATAVEWVFVRPSARLGRGAAWRPDPRFHGFGDQTLVWLLAMLLLSDTVPSPFSAGVAFKVPVAPGESLAVETAGTGAPVVLIPGLFGSAFGFRTLVPLLTGAGYRTLVIEPLGIGSSSRPRKANYSLTAQTARLAAVFDSLHVRDALVIAHSIGGSEGFRLAYRRPDLVRGLLSIEGGPTESAVTPAFKRALRFAPWIKLFGGIRLIRRKIRGLLLDSSGDSSWVTDAVVDGYTASAARDLDATLRAYLAMGDAREPGKLAPHLAEVRCPVRLMVGGTRHDGSVGPEEVVLLSRTLPAFSIDSVPGAGHFIFEEQPRTVLAAVTRLVASVTTARARGSQ